MSESPHAWRQYRDAQQLPDYPWHIYRNGTPCAFARTRTEADRIVRQLQKIHRDAVFKVEYRGANISHCGDGGRPL